jgi:hypothetical protein
MNSIEDFHPMMRVRDIYGEKGRVISTNAHTGVVWVRVWAENVPYLPDQLIIEPGQHTDEDMPELNDLDE